MKLVTAVIKPHKWEDVREALAAAGISGMTVTEASGFGQQKGHVEDFEGAEYDVTLVPKIRIEVVIDDAEVDTVVETIAEASKTGTIGDGKVWVMGIDALRRVRTGETGEAAL